MDIDVEEYGLISYRRAYARQLELVELLHREQDRHDICLMLEHPAVFTLGRNGKSEHVGVSETFLEQKGVELIRVERGGEVTYHGPGQIVCYPIFNLRRSGLSVADFVSRLEQAMLEVAHCYGVQATRDQRNRGIWVENRKLGSVGIAIRHGITYHGLALNVDPDLEPFRWINPCGLTGVSMTSLERESGEPMVIETVRETLITAIAAVFSRTVKRPASGTKAAGTKKIGSTAKPKWLKKRLPSGSGYEKTRRLVNSGRLHTVCQEARCPNQFECYGKGTATFMIMGDKCTRNCRFCAVDHAPTGLLDAEEPARIAAAVVDMALDYVVLTSVTRDDLSDGGASHFAATIEAIRAAQPHARVEVLIPDLQGDLAALKALCAGHPTVLNHNLETIARLYSRVRPQADYQRSLDLLRWVKKIDSNIVTKSGLMVGLGETIEELSRTMTDIRDSGCSLLTIGQYLQPSAAHLPVKRFVPPHEFDQLREMGLDLGFAAVAAGPHVRSSYQAGQLYRLAVGRVVS